MSDYCNEHPMSCIQVDLLHPTFVTLKWTGEHLNFGVKHTQAAHFNGKLYMGGTSMTKTGQPAAKLYSYIISSKSEWKIEVDPPVYNFALVSYKSELLLIGGKVCSKENEIADFIWTYDKIQQKFEKHPTLQLNRKRCGASATSCDDTLVVAGGEALSSESDRNVIEIYRDLDHWEVEQPRELLYDSEEISIVIFNQQLFLKSGLKTFFTSLDSLGVDTETSWKHVNNIPDPLSWGTLAVFGQRLVVTNGAVIFAYSFCTGCWIPVEESNERSDILGSCAVVLPTQEDMVIFGGDSSKASLTSDRIVFLKLNFNGMYTAITIPNCYYYNIIYFFLMEST